MALVEVGTSHKAWEDMCTSVDCTFAAILSNHKDCKYFFMSAGLMRADFDVLIIYWQDKSEVEVKVGSNDIEEGISHIISRIIREPCRCY